MFPKVISSDAGSGVFQIPLPVTPDCPNYHGLAHSAVKLLEEDEGGAELYQDPPVEILPPPWDPHPNSRDPEGSVGDQGHVCGD